MPSKHKAGGCNCCGCGSNEDARVELLALYGLSDITCSGGPSQAATTDWRQLTCAPSYPDGSTKPQFPAFDFSGAVIEAITASPGEAVQKVCPPYDAEYGTLDWGCSGTDLYARGFTILSGSDCPYGAGYVSAFGYLAASVVFNCVDGVASYRLSITSQYNLFIREPGGGGFFPSLPTTGVDWTRADFGSIASVFTKNGSTDDEGSYFSTLISSSGGGLTTLRFAAGSTTSNPNTTVSMWVPDPVIDWTGLSHSGTATLS